MHARFLIYHWGVWGCYRRAVLSQGPSSFSYLMSPHFLPRFEGHQLINQNVLSEQRDLCSFAGHLIWTGWWEADDLPPVLHTFLLPESCRSLSFSCIALERIIHKMILSNLIFFPWLYMNYQISVMKTFSEQIGYNYITVYFNRS